MMARVTSLALELADKQTDDRRLGREFELSSHDLRAKLGSAKNINVERVNAEHFDPADLNPEGLNDTYEDALANMKNYRRVDRSGQSRAYAYANYRASVAATEIGKTPAASDIAKQRGLARQIAQQTISARSTMRKPCIIQPFPAQGRKKVLGRGM